uniref:Uncharacterized protein n=1 Tax=Anguilla anguilla TaxID=7936 RepID=A0A0E9RVX8_ANGAN
MVLNKSPRFKHVGGLLRFTKTYNLVTEPCGFNVLFKEKLIRQASWVYVTLGLMMLQITATC